MKKILISFAALAVSAAAIIAVNVNNSMDEQFEANVEALAEGEGRYFILPPTVTFGENTHADEEMCYDLPCDLQEIELPELKK